MHGPLALVGGGEWREGCTFDRELLAASGADEVLVLPTAAASEHPVRAVETAEKWFAGLGAKARGLMVLARPDAELEANVAAIRDARFIYLSGGSPLHLRSVIKETPLWDALVEAFSAGAVVAGSSAGAMVLGDPMVDPRGGAYTVGLGVVSNLAIFPYHGSAADHLRQRSIELLAEHAILAGVDEHTALVRPPEGQWRALGAGAVTLYSEGRVQSHHDSEIDTLKM